MKRENKTVNSTIKISTNFLHQFYISKKTISQNQPNSTIFVPETSRDECHYNTFFFGKRQFIPVAFDSYFRKYRSHKTCLKKKLQNFGISNN